MIFKVLPPGPQLRAFIKDYLILHFKFDKSSFVPAKPFPANTLQCLVFYVKGFVTAKDPKTGLCKVLPKVAINGSITSRLDYLVSNDCLIISVGFHPGALSKFLRLPMTEFVDERIEAEAVLNPEILRVQERLINEISYDNMVRIVEEFLLKRIQNLKMDKQPIDKVVQLIYENPNSFRIEKMANEACLSLSQFERRFMKLTGITPKYFARITRFYNAFQLKDRNPKSDWLSIALESGYYDYQHLVKDFRQFANVSPHSLLVAQAHSPERILGLG